MTESVHGAIGDWMVTFGGYRLLTNHPSGQTWHVAERVQLTYAPPVEIVNGRVTNIQPITWSCKMVPFHWSSNWSVEDLTVCLCALLAESPQVWEGPQLSTRVQDSLTESIGTTLELALNPPA